MIETVLIVLEVIVCIALIAAIMMQSGKGGGMSGTFGGSDGAFFGKGNDLDTVLAKATICLGTAFAVITLALAKINA
ncbi:MAG: preprotein translocase subunit SecG [Phascolarctobacterium sp.]|nr:preprotein translocase subunit SecG [Phascolarctobacterium sp.]